MIENTNFHLSHNECTGYSSIGYIKTCSKDSNFLWNSDNFGSIIGKHRKHGRFDFLTTQFSLSRALFIIACVIKSGGTILFVNTLPSLTLKKICSFFLNNEVKGVRIKGRRKGISSLKSHLNLNNNRFPQIISSLNRWVPGALTNYRQVSRSIYSYALCATYANIVGNKKILKNSRYNRGLKYFKNFIYKRQIKRVGSSVNKGQYKYMVIERYYVSYALRPDLVIVVNPLDNRHLIKEANKLHIPVIGIVQTNVKWLYIDYPIFSNPTPLFVYTLLKKIVKLCHIYLK
ncbi:30S ribosomal protein S2 [Paenibacillus sp. MAHUQ-46]|uniref:Small ribosomal subunit protein uS2 n=1 Tax=Paenibacillus roseus TaxID=2798579 RepID=A0A934MNY3_9BACL|nr:30S ribosomal protein S2 [Paenibacillus roseus]MBJ6361496.1 30S ribosomal protein S2 [Paenibacillus roseus]